MLLRYCFAMRPLSAILFSAFFLLAWAGSVQTSPAADAISGKIVKVLPLFLDTNNEVAPSPSLFDRDAYQAYLLLHTNDISGIRFDATWNAWHAHGVHLKLRIEARGIGKGGLPTQAVLEKTVTPKIFHHWTSLTLRGADYTNFGVLAAWRATLWNGNRLIGEQESFLWSPP